MQRINDTVLTTVLLSDAGRAALRKIARQRGCSVGALIREACAAHYPEFRAAAHPVTPGRVAGERQDSQHRRIA